MKDVAEDGGRHAEDTALSTQKLKQPEKELAIWLQLPESISAGVLSTVKFSSLPPLAVSPVLQKEARAQVALLTTLIFKCVYVRIDRKRLLGDAHGDVK